MALVYKRKDFIPLQTFQVNFLNLKEKPKHRPLAPSSRCEVPGEESAWWPEEVEEVEKLRRLRRGSRLALWPQALIC